MKNKLLLTTALALFVGSVSNVYAEEKSGKIDYQETITVSQGQELTLDNAYTEEDGDDEGILYTSKFTVENGGTLTASDTDIVATSATGNAVELKGMVVLDGTSIMAGDNNESKRNMLIDGADITFNTTSDLLAAIGDLTIKNTVINATNLNSEDEDDTDLAGLNALGKINIENSTINAPDSMIVSGRDIDEDEGTSFGGDDITISGSSTDINIEEIGIYGEGNIYINDGKITAQAIGAEHGNLNIVGGTVNLIEGSDGLYADETLNVKGGIVNITGQNRIGAEKFKMSDGELNIKGTTYVYTNNPVDISGGSLNIADGAIFGWKTVDSDSDIDFGKNATLNLSGTLNANIESLGTINVKNNSAKIAGSAEISEGGILNIGENKLTVAGDITFDESSTLKMSVTDKGNGSLSARNIVAEKDAKLVLDVTKSMNVGDETTATLFSATGKVDNNFTNEISNERYKVTTEDGKTYKIVYENTASDVIDNVDDTHAVDALRNFWICEIKELAAARRAEINAVKSFIERSTDHYRAAYARRAQTFNRHCVFAITVNDKQFLRDLTGNRRYWILESPLAEFRYKEGFTDDYIKQIWAEVFSKFQELTADGFNDKILELPLDLKQHAEKVADKFTVNDGLQSEISAFLDKPILPLILWNVLTVAEKKKFSLTQFIELSENDWLKRKQYIHADKLEEYQMALDNEKFTTRTKKFDETYIAVYGSYIRQETCASEIYNEFSSGGDKRKQILRINEALGLLDGWKLSGKRNVSFNGYGDQKNIFKRIKPFNIEAVINNSDTHSDIGDVDLPF